LPRTRPHHIPVKPGQLRYLLSLEPFRDQNALAQKLGTSARYIRWMLSGDKPGYKHQRKIQQLYEYHRRRGTRQVIRRVAAPQRQFVSMDSVVKVLKYVFQPTDVQTTPTAKRPWQDRRTRFASKERRTSRKRFDSWDGFSIVAVRGLDDYGDKALKRYGKVIALPEGEPTTMDSVMERWESLTDKEYDVVSHLPIEEWLEELGGTSDEEPEEEEEGDGTFLIFNFWVSRFSERPKAGGFGGSRDPNDPNTFAAVEAVARLNAESASDEDGHFQYDVVGVYAFTGWNKRPGKKPPRQ
jgi:hypothetical protein